MEYKFFIESEVDTFHGEGCEKFLIVKPKNEFFIETEWWGEEFGIKRKKIKKEDGEALLIKLTKETAARIEKDQSFLKRLIYISNLVGV